MSAGAIGARLDRAGRSVAGARAALASGRAVDLGSLEVTVNAACRGVGALPDAQGRALKPRLVALLDDLNGLADALAHEHAALKKALAELAARERAHSAYRTPAPKRG